MKYEARIIESQDIDEFNKLITTALNGGWYLANNMNVSDKGYSILSQRYIEDRGDEHDD